MESLQEENKKMEEEPHGLKIGSINNDNNDDDDDEDNDDVKMRR